MTTGVKDEEKRKLARLINDALDAGMIEAGLISPNEIRPFNDQPGEVQAVIVKAAGVVYDALVWDKAAGEIRVLPKGHSF
jgi:hypothetical protein